MTYRETDPAVPGEPQLGDIATSVKMRLLNGERAELAIPCRYVTPAVAPATEYVVTPILLRDEGYIYPLVVAFSGAPAGLEGSAWIDADDQSLVRILFSARCPDAVTRDVTCDVSVLITRIGDDDEDRTDVVLRGPLTIEAAPYEGPALQLPQGPSTGLATMYADMFGYGVLKDFAGSVAADTLTITDGSALIHGRFFEVTDPIEVDLTGLSGSLRLIVSGINGAASSLRVVPIAQALPQNDYLFDLPIATLTKSGAWNAPVFAYEMAGTFTDPVGSYKSFALEAIPKSHLVANGAAVSRVIYARLFGKIGTSYGAGDGSTTFNLPNLTGRVGVARAPGDTEFGSLDPATWGGAKTHTLTEAQIPAHDHPVAGKTGYHSDLATGGSSQNNWYGTSSINTSNAGGGEAHNNLQPYAVEVVCIRA